jgi:hypothetical protein
LTLVLIDASHPRLALRARCLPCGARDHEFEHSGYAPGRSITLWASGRVNAVGRCRLAAGDHIDIRRSA